MPGGFHPFHAGHAALYQSAVKAFPDAEVYVAATNDTSTRPFPFSIKEKLAKLAGVAPGHFVQVKSPFRAEEITSHYNPNEDVLIFVRSEKDRNESPKPGGTKKDGTPAYFQPYTGKNLEPFSKHAYFAYLPTVEFGPGIKSATEIRNAWPKLNDKRKTAMVMSLYPVTQSNPKLAANVVKMLDMGMGEQAMAESHSTAIAHTAKSLSNPPKVMQHRAKRDQEREQQWLGTQLVKRDKTHKDAWGDLKESVVCSDKVPKLSGLSFKELNKLVEGCGSNYSMFDSALKKNLNLPNWANTIEMFGIYLRKLNENKLGKVLSEGEQTDIEQELFRKLSTGSNNSIDSAKVGDRVSLLHLITLNIPGHKVVAKLNGFLNPKKIIKIIGDGDFKQLKFDDGSEYPNNDKADIFQQTQGWNMTKLFPSHESASKAYTYCILAGEEMSSELDFKITVEKNLTESTNLSVEQLAHISDKALDDAYHYGRSTPGANFGWLANIQSAKAAKRLIDSGETDIEKISDAIHKGWNITAAADYKGQLKLDTPTPDDKKLKRAKLAMQSYAQLPEEEKEKDRVVARALLAAMVGKVDESFGLPYPTTYEQEYGKVTNESIDYLEEK